MYQDSKRRLEHDLSSLNEYMMHEMKLQLELLVTRMCIIVSVVIIKVV